MPASTLIRVESCPDGHRVRLFVENGRPDWLSEAVSTAELPAVPDADHCEEIRETLLTANGASPRFREIGRDLYDVLLANEVGDALENRLATDPSTRVLIDAGTDALRMLPWELLRDPAGDQLFLNEIHPVARAAASIDIQAHDPGLCWPLRVLIVQGTDDPAVRALEEIERVRDAFRSVCGFVDIEVLTRPALPHLKRVYGEFRPHVFHFVGHGTSDADGTSYLELQPDGGGAVAWTGPLIRAMLQRWRPCLAVLNACQTADLTGQAGALGVAAAFGQLGVPAVVSMQGKVSGETAPAFAGALYEQLAAGHPIDQAVVAARVEVLMAAEGDDREYALPTLMLGRLPESVIDLSKGDPPAALAQTPFTHVQRYVNRTSDRRALWKRVEPLQPSPAVAIVGDEKAGKSALVHWCLGLRKLQGDNVAYVDLSKGDRVDSAGILEAIAQALEGAPTPFAERNAAAMAAYRVDVAPLIDKPDDWSGVFSAFSRALEAAAGGGNVLIALDHLNKVEQWHWKQLICPHLVRTIARGNLPRVRLILSLHSAQRAELLPASVEDIVGEVRLTPLLREHYRDVTTQFLRSQGFRRLDFEPVLDALLTGLPANWDANQFELLRLIMQNQNWERE